MAPTLTELLSRETLNPVVLIQIEPKAKLDGFVISGVYTYTYEREWSHREPSAVFEDDSELTEQTSIANVEATTGSWYFDGSKVYVHTTGDDDPSGYLIHLVSEFRFSFIPSGETEWDSKHWEPLGVRAKAPTISDSIPTIFDSEVYGQSTNFTLSNADGFFDDISRVYQWDLAKVSIYWGLKELEFSDFQAAFIGFLQNPSWAENEIAFDCIDQRRIFSEEELPEEEFLQANYPDLADSSEGCNIPIYFGPWTTVQCILIEDNSPTSWKYKICSHRLNSIDEVQIGGTPTSSSNWTGDLANGEFTLTVDPGTDEVTATIQGYHNGSKYVETAIEQALEIVKMSSLDSGLIDETSFTAAAAENPATTRYAITSKTSISTILASFALDAALIFDFNSSGQLRCSTWDPSIPSDAPHFYEYPDFLTKPEQSSTTEDIYAKVIVIYDRDTDGVERRKVAENTETPILTGRKKQKEVICDLLEESAAADLAQRYIFYTGTRSAQVSLQLSARAMTLSLGSKLRLTSARGADASGAWEGKVFEVISISKNFNTLQVQVTLEDLKGLGSDIFFYTADTAVNWSSSSQAEQDSQGYWGDGDGYCDPENTRRKILM